MPSDTDGTAATTDSGSNRFVVVTAGALLALFLASVDASAVSTALPKIVGDLHGAALYSWPGTAFMVAAAVVVPVAGKLSDVFGRRAFLYTGLVGFVAASLLCGLAGNMIQLVIYRAVQGVFGGMLLATILIVLGDLNEGEGRAKAQGMASATFGIGSIVGSPIGGFITDALSWRWIFYVNIPLGAVAFVALLGLPASLGKKATAGWRDVDTPGVLTLAVGIVAVLIGLSTLNDPGASTSAALTLVVVGAVVLAGFVFVETKVDSPVVPLGILRKNQMAVLATAGFLINFGVLAASYYIPLLYQGVLGASPSNAGSRQIPLMAALVVASVLSGRLFPKVKHYRFLASGALAVLAATMWWLSRSDPATALWVPMVALVLCGATIGLVYPILTTVVQSAVSRDQLGVATSQISFWRTLGGPVALAVMGGIFGAPATGGSLGTPSEVADNLQWVFIAAAVVVAVAALIVLLLHEIPLAKPEAPADGDAPPPEGEQTREHATAGVRR